MWEMENIVKNISSQQLTATEMKVWNYGFGFALIPVYNTFQSCIDLFRRTRLLKLKKMFGTQTTSEPPIFKEKIDVHPKG